MPFKPEECFETILTPFDKGFSKHSGKPIHPGCKTLSCPYTDCVGCKSLEGAKDGGARPETHLTWQGSRVPGGGGNRELKLRGSSFKQLSNA